MMQILEGDDVTEGRKDDAAVTNPAASASVVSLLKGIMTRPPVRGEPVLLRDFTITGCISPAQTLADVTGSGSLVANTTYRVSVMAMNDRYWAAPSTATTQATANDGGAHSLRVTIPKAPGATAYVVFCSTGATASYLATVTESQRAAGGCRITGLDAVDAAGSNPAGTVDVRAVATATMQPISTATAYTNPRSISPDNLVAVYPTTVADVATGGSLSPNTSYCAALAPATRYGTSKASAPVAVTTASDGNSTHCVRLTVPQTPGAESYVVFLSAGNQTTATAAAVGTITEAQRAAGGCRITGNGEVDAAGSNPAGTVDICVVGAGTAANAECFNLSSACPVAPATLDALTTVNCDGYSKLRLYVKLEPSDLRGYCGLSVILFEKLAAAGEWFSLPHSISTPSTIPSGNGALTLALPISQNAPNVFVDGASDIVPVIALTTGYGFRCRIWGVLYN